MQINIILDPRQSADELASLGALAEANGIEGLLVSSLVQSRDPFANMTVLAKATRRLVFGPVAVNPWDTHPVRIAASLLTLNEFAAGRARIVIGGGAEALSALGIKPHRRVRAVRECVEIMKLAMSGQAVEYVGELYQAHRLQFTWASAPPPPVYVGASMPMMLRMAARVADGIMMSDMPVVLATEAIATLDAALASVDRSRDSFLTNMFSAIHLHQDRQVAVKEAKRWLVFRGIFRPNVLALFLDANEVQQVMTNEENFWAAFTAGSDQVEGVDDAVLDKLVEHVTLTGAADDVDAIIAKLKAYARVGLSHISLRLYANADATIRLIGSKILPAVRDGAR